MKLTHEDRIAIKEAINDDKRRRLLEAGSAKDQQLLDKRTKFERRVDAIGKEAVYEGQAKYRRTRREEALRKAGFELVDGEYLRCMTCKKLTSKRGKLKDRHTPDCPIEPASIDSRPDRQ